MSKQPPAKRRRTELTLKDKIELINEATSSLKISQKDLGKKYGIGASTVSNILQKKALYIAEYEKNSSGNKLRFNNACKYDDINEITWRWFSQARAKNIPISEPIIQEKALSVANDFWQSDFKASNGWLESWKSRYSVRGFKISGESAGVDSEIVDDFKNRIPDIVSDYEPKDVFNCDETGLYWRALPDKTLAAKGESTKGIKNSKERITVMLACSATGEKLQPLVIGKSANPRCFKNVKVNRLPVAYEANKKAWMNSYVFFKS